MDDDLFYKIALSLIPGIGSVLARNLVEYTGGPAQVFSEPYKSLMKIPGIGTINSSHIKSKEVLIMAEKEMSFVEKNSIDVRFFADDNFPRRLKYCPDAPVILYVKGNVDIDEQRVVSIVGTRKATDYGREICQKLIKGFADRKYPVLVVSGLAYGIDVQAHKSALKYNIPTVGVVGHGLEKIYPSLHLKIARKMVENGAIISEFHSDSLVEPGNFVRRNRIIAGLADATIVVESAEKGGALITADIASSYNRDVFAFPGSVNNKYSRGCNKLIRLNGAALIQDIDDLEYFMGWELEEVMDKEIQTELFVELDENEKRVVDILRKNERMYIDEISSNLKIQSSKASTLLMKMEFKNIVMAMPGNMYKLRD